MSTFVILLQHEIVIILFIGVVKILNEYFFEFSNFLIFILAVYMIMLFFVFYLKMLRRDRKYKKVKYTMEFCLKDDRNYNEVIGESINFSQEYNNHSINDNMKIIFSESNNILDHFEKISIAIKFDVFDEMVIESYYREYFLIYYEELKYPIMEQRIYSNNPYMYIEYEKRVHLWKNANDFKYSKGMSV